MVLGVNVHDLYTYIIALLQV